MKFRGVGRPRCRSEASASRVEFEPGFGNHRGSDLPIPRGERVKLLAPAADVGDRDASWYLVLHEPVRPVLDDDHRHGHPHTRRRHTSRITIAVPGTSTQGGTAELSPQTRTGAGISQPPSAREQTPHGDVHRQPSRAPTPGLGGPRSPAGAEPVDACQGQIPSIPAAVTILSLADEVGGAPGIPKELPGANGLASCDDMRP